MKKTTTVFMAAAMAASVSFAAPQKAADLVVSGYTGSTPLENFPVLVRISPTRISGFSYADCAADGRDIAFEDAQGNVLAREIDTWNPNGESLVWVRVPTLANDIVLKMTYKDSTVAAQPACQTDGSVWTPAGYVGVWHMNATSPADVTGSGNNGTGFGSVTVTDGKIGSALSYPNTSAYVSCGSSQPDAGLIGGFTIEGWVNLANTSGNKALFGKSGFISYRMEGTAVKITTPAVADYVNVTSFITAANEWHYFALTFVPNTTGGAKHYADGVLRTAQNTGAIRNTTGSIEMWLGHNQWGSDQSFVGLIDEYHLSASVRSADWIAASYATQANAAFLTYGAASSLASDSMLAICGAPGEIGLPSPSYGPVDNLSVGTPVALSMSATVVPGEGTVTNYLAGWKLESVNAETGVRTLLRSSSDANEVSDSCAYIHASFAAFTWLWDVRDRLGVGVPSVVSKGQNALVLSADVTGIGYTAPSATLKFAYGVSPDALVYTNVVSSSVTDVGSVQASLTRLAPGSVYFIKAIIETNDESHDVAESAILRVQTEALDERMGAPGLIQAKYANKWYTGAWNIADASDANRVLGAWAAHCGSNFSGTVPWKSADGQTSYSSWGDNTTWGYSGYMYFENKTYTFGGAMDDNVRLCINGEQVLDQSGSTLKTVNWTPPDGAGWYPIEIRVGNGTGGNGPYGGFYGLCWNTTGYTTKDTSSKWNKFVDPGDGSLLRTPVKTTITASEVIGNGALASVTLSFNPADSARALRVAWGPAHGGNDPSGWYATSSVATVAAGATAATWTPPADWGSDSNLVVRFYFDGDLVEWSNSIFWRDYSAPSVTDMALDGRGGDTLVISGTLASFAGADCTLSVLIGDSPMTLDTAWTGLAGSVRNTTGDFTLTLFEGDTTSPRYLTPGATYHVAVEAVSNGRVSRTEPVAVKMLAASVFRSSSTSVARRTVTFTGAFSNLGHGASPAVTLFVGAATDSEQDLVAAESTTVTDLNAFTLTHVFPAFETSYKWQLRAIATAAGGTSTFETRTAVATVTTLDTTTYTWTGAGADNKWSNPDNWTDNQGGDVLGYPHTASATAFFKTDATVDVDVYATIGTLNLSGAYNLNILFTSADTVANRLTLNNLTFPKVGSTWTLDHVYIYRDGEFWPTEGITVELRNKAYLYCTSNEGLRANNARIVLGEDATNNVNNIYIGKDGSYVVSNGYFNVRGSIYLASNTTGGELLFKGVHPKLYSAAVGATFQPETANCRATLGFEVPEGGYDAPPISGVASKTQYFFGTANAKNITISILDSSPALRGASPTTTTLVSWSKGFSTDNMTYGAIATADLGSAFAIADTTNLNVTIVPANRADRLTILSDCGTPTPAVGLHTGYVSGSTYQLSAGEAVISSDTRRVPVGWKRYAVDEVTGERTFVAEGEGATLSYEHPGEWTAIEWIWRDDCLTSVEGDGNGTATISAEWSDIDAFVTATAIPAEGWRFSYWSGDITDVPILRNPATFRSDRPRELVANFVPADLVVSDNTYTGAKDGSWNIDANWSLGHVPTAEENAIVPTGKGTVKITNAGRCASLQIVNDVSLQLQGSGTVTDDQIRLDVRGNAVSTGNGLILGSSGTSIYDVFFDVGGDLCISNNNRNAAITVYAGDAYGTNTDAKIRSGYVGDTSAPRLRAYWRGGAQVNVGGKFVLSGTHASNTSTLNIHSHYKTGMSPIFRAGSVEIGKQGRITGYQNGWRSYNAALMHGIGAGRGSGGASYGGLGGLNDASYTQARAQTYGYEKAPFWPGSAGGPGGTDGGYGGSLFRLHATGDVVLDGTINVNGYGWWSNTQRAGGSGGGVWITCDTFSAGANASISAKGGDHSISGGPAGGGGRVAVAAGCTSETDIASFLQTGDCAGYVANDFSETLWPTLVKISGGVNTADGAHYAWNDGAAGTAKYLQNASGKSVLTITGNPLEVGEASPAYVTHIVDTGDVLCENGEYGYVPGTSNGTRWILDGYVWTNAATSGSGSSASVTVPVQGDTTLVWIWRDLEHNLVATSGGYGEVSAHDNWIADGASVTLTATPYIDAVFVRWTGDIDEASATSPTITFAMTSPRRLIAVFDKPGTTPRNLAYSGGDWFTPAIWDGVAIPGTNDVVTLSSGTLNIPFGATIDVGDLVVSGGTLTFAPTQGAYNSEAASEYGTPLMLHVAGDLILSGSAKLNLGVQNGDVRADVVVDGDMTVSGTAQINAYASAGELDDALRTWRHYKAGGAAFLIGGDLVFADSAKAFVHTHSHTGVGVIWDVGGNVTIGASAQISGSSYTSDNNSYGYGFAARYGFYIDTIGGSYGGNGGNGGSGDYTYGFAYAPYYPGTAGRGNKRDSRGQGGGSVRINAGGVITLDGKIYVTGGHCENIDQHAGSGGGVWLTCASFEAGASALVHACGGRSNQHGTCYGGGGGRVCIITGSPSEEQIDSLYATGAAEDILVVAADMNDALVSPWPALVNVTGGENNDNRSNATYGGHGKPGTCVYLQNSAGRAVVTVSGNQDTTETVPPYGQSTVETGEQTFTAPAFIYFNDGRSRYPCLGYEWEDAAGNTGSGVTTNFTLDVRRDLTITWRWGALEHLLDVRDGGFCTVSYEAQGANEPGWYDVGTVVRVTCSPEDAQTTFDCWLGDVDESVKNNLFIDVAVDTPKVVIATLHRDAARARPLVWTGEGDGIDWFDKANWDGVGIPGKYDSALITNGTFQVMYPSAVEIASLAVSNSATGFWGANTTVSYVEGANEYSGGTRAYYTRAFSETDVRPYSLAVSGDFAVGSSAKLYFGGVFQTNRMDIAVGGDMTIGGGTSGNRTRLQMYAGYQGPWTDVETFVLGGGSLTVGGTFTLDGYGEFSPTAHIVSGAPVPLKAGSVTIGKNAVIDANARGFGRFFFNPGTGWRLYAYGCTVFTQDNGKGPAGSHGGLGGGCTAGVNDREVAPVYPGGAGGLETWGAGTGNILSGGGAVRIDAETIVLEGRILAYGIGSYCAAGGAGGGVWLTCRNFTLGTGGHIGAEGGRATAYGGSGGGGGGRIAIGLKFSPMQLERMYRRGQVGGMKVTPLAEITEGTEFAEIIGNPWTGRFSVLGGYGLKAAGGTGDVSPAVRADPGTAVVVEAPAVGTMLIMR